MWTQGQSTVWSQLEKAGRTTRLSERRKIGLPIHEVCAPPTSCIQKTLPPERQGWRSDFELCAHLGFNPPFQALVSKHTQVTKLCHSSQTNPESIITSISLCNVGQNKEKRRDLAEKLTSCVLRTQDIRQEEDKLKASPGSQNERLRWGRIRRRGRLTRKGGGEKVQSLMCLPYMHKGLRLNQRIHVKKKKSQVWQQKRVMLEGLPCQTSIIIITKMDQHKNIHEDWTKLKTQTWIHITTVIYYSTKTTTGEKTEPSTNGAGETGGPHAKEWLISTTLHKN